MEPLTFRDLPERQLLYPTIGRTTNATVTSLPRVTHSTALPTLDDAAVFMT